MLRLLTLLLLISVAVGQSPPVPGPSPNESFDYSCVALTEDGALYQLDGNQGASTLVGQTGYRGMIGLAHDSATRTFYGFTEQGEVVAIDGTTGTGRTLTLVHGSPVVLGLAYHGDALVAVGHADASDTKPRLYRLPQPFSAATSWTRVGSDLGMPGAVVAGLTVDPESGHLVTMSMDQGPLLVDPHTGVAKPASAASAAAAVDASAQDLRWVSAAFVSTHELLAVAGRGAATLFAVSTRTGRPTFLHLLQASRIRGLHCELGTTSPGRQASMKGTAKQRIAAYRSAVSASHPATGEHGPRAVSDFVVRRVAVLPDYNLNYGINAGSAPLGTVPVLLDGSAAPMDFSEESRYSTNPPGGQPRGIEWDVTGQPPRLRIQFEASGFFDLGVVSGLCDVDPSRFVGVAPATGATLALVPVPGHAYYTTLASTDTPPEDNSYLLIWVDPKGSYVGGNLLRLEYEWWTLGSSRETDSQGSLCGRPTFWDAGKRGGSPHKTRLYALGQDLGTSLDILRMRVNNAGSSFPCSDETIIVPNRLATCMISGTGSDLTLNGEVNAVAITSSVPYSFRQFQNTQIGCQSTEYVDAEVNECVCAVESDCSGTTSEEPRKETLLRDVLSGFMQELSDAQREADDDFLQVAELYRTEPLRQLSPQRHRIPNAAFSLSMAIEGSNPALTVNPVARQNIGYDVSLLASVTLTLRSESARWVSTYNEETESVEYALDV